MITILFGWFQRRSGSTPDRALAAHEPAEPVPGCGWFDSSHELQHGLLVIEEAAGNELAAWQQSLISGAEPELEFG